MSKQVFISYSTDDTAIAEQIRDGLEAASIACWMAPRDIAPGLDYGTQIIDAIEACTVLVLVLSESSNHSVFVRNEVERAIAKRKVVIPFRIHDVQPSRGLEFFISNAQWIDAWQPPMETHLASLAAAIRNHRSTIPPVRPPVNPIVRPPVPSPTHEPATPRTNLPRPSTPFIGRERELAAILEQLHDPACRLLTLVGQGGMGKTRLVMEAARRLLDEMTLRLHGVFFVALDALTSSEQIAPAIISALGFPPVTQSDSHNHLHILLEEKRLLLVLDNFEHLLEGATLVSEILAAAPNIQILVTSRAALALQEEWLYPIGGMDLPAASAHTTEELLSSSAVQMFVQSARRVRPNFALATESEHVVQLCRMVDGMPLALELAAAWLRTLTCAQIVAELHGSLELLATSMRNIPSRHRSIQAVFDQSWQLLDKAERAILCQFVVFEGGFDWAAARAVTGVSLPMLTELVDRSWLQVNQETRYTLHPLVYSYLLTKLNAEYSALSGEMPGQVHDRHSRYFATLDKNASLRGLEREISNMRAGWFHATQQLDVATLLQYTLGGVRSTQWLVLTGAGDQMLERTLSRLGDTETTGRSTIHRHLTTVLLCRRAELLSLAGQLQRAEAVALECLAYLDRFPEADRGVDNPWGEERNPVRGTVQTYQAYSLISQGRLHEADTLLKELLAKAQNLNHTGWEAYLLHFLAYSAAECGRYAEAATYLHQGLALMEDRDKFHLYNRLAIIYYLTGQYELVAQVLTMAAPRADHFPYPHQRLELQVLWARLDIVAQDLATARVRCLAVLPRAREISSRNVEIWAIIELGRIALLEEKAEEACRYFEEAMAIADGMGRRSEQARARVGLGQAAIAQGKIDVAKRIFQQAIAIAWPQDILPEVIGGVIGLAEIAEQEGRDEQAAAWLRMAVEHPATPHHIRQEAEAVLVALADNAPVSTASLEEIVAVLLASPEAAVVENTQ